MRGLHSKALVCVALCAAVGVSYWQISGHEFVSVDDRTLVVANPIVNRGLTLEGVSLAFTSFYASNWMPLTWISHMIDVSLFGLSAPAHHFTNVLFHMANSCLLFIALTRLMSVGCRRRPEDRSARADADSFWQCALVAALFALHPAHVETVAWVSERRDLVASFFGFLALVGYARYVEHPASRARYGAVLIALALGLMAKPVLVTLPFVLLLLDYWPLRRIQWTAGATARFGEQLRPLLVEKIPLFALVLASGIVTFLAQLSGGSVQSLEVLPFGERVANALISYVRYLRILVWPSGLNALYPRLDAASLSLSWPVVAAATLLLACTLGAIRRARTLPYLTVGWFWFLGTLVPMIGLIQVGEQALADRYTYLSYVGPFIALAWTARELASRSRAARIATVVGGALALGALLTLTWRQVGYWQDSFSLFRRAVEVDPHNARALEQLGVLHFRAGDLDRALELSQQAVDLRADSVSALNNHGNVLLALRRLGEAEAQYARAFELEPDSAGSRVNLGLVKHAQGIYSETVALFAPAFDSEPGLREQRTVVARYFEALRRQITSGQVRLEAGAEHYRRAIRQFPDQRYALDEFTWILATHPESTPRHGVEAIDYARSAIGRAGGESVRDLDVLAAALATAERFDEAVATAERALKMADRADLAALTDEVGRRLELYRSGRAYREYPVTWSPKPDPISD